MALSSRAHLLYICQRGCLIIYLSFYNYMLCLQYSLLIYYCNCFIRQGIAESRVIIITVNAPNAISHLQSLDRCYIVTPMGALKIEIIIVIRYDMIFFAPGITAVTSAFSFKMFILNLEGEYNDFQHCILAKSTKPLFGSFLFISKVFCRMMSYLNPLKPHIHMQSLNISRTLLQCTFIYQSCSVGKLCCVAAK